MIELEALDYSGGDLSRPECVLTHSSGLLMTADWTDSGGVAIFRHADRAPALRILSNQQGFQLRPNGIALEDDGGVIATHLGEDQGGVFRLHLDGALEPLVTEIDGVALPPTNFVHRDGAGRLWITVSTRQQPRAKGYSAAVADGFIALANADGSDVRIVADGLGYTNECALHPDGRWLYVNETFARRLSRFSVEEKGRLGERQTVCEFGPGTFPDGVTFDVEGGAWITSIVSNRVIRVSPTGEQSVVLEDSDEAYLKQVEEAFDAGRMGRPHLDGVVSRRLGHVSSLAFGGSDLDRAYLGCLLGDRLASFQAPVRGVAPIHWRAPLTRLRSALAGADA